MSSSMQSDNDDGSLSLVADDAPNSVPVSPIHKLNFIWHELESSRNDEDLIKVHLPMSVTDYLL